MKIILFITIAIQICLNSLLARKGTEIARSSAVVRQNKTTYKRLTTKRQAKRNRVWEREQTVRILFYINSLDVWFILCFSLTKGLCSKLTLDFTFHIGSTPPFPISIRIWTLRTQHTKFFKETDSSDRVTDAGRIPDWQVHGHTFTDKNPKTLIWYTHRHEN